MLSLLREQWRAGTVASLTWEKVILFSMQPGGEMQADQQSQPEVRNMEERAVVPGILNLSTLEERCMSEVANDCFRDPAGALFSFELFHRAASQGNQEAREECQRCFSGILREWLHHHPRKEGHAALTAKRAISLKPLNVSADDS